MADADDELALLEELAKLAREGRQQSGKKQSHFAAAADVDQSTITRFEQGKAWPRHPERVVAAYAEVLGRDRWELWETALERARKSRNGGAP